MDSQSDKQKLIDQIKGLSHREEYYRTRVFYLLIEFAFVFAVPAFGGLALGRYLDNQFATGHFWLTVCLVCAFVLSWSIVIWRYLKIDREMRAVAEQIKEAKAELKKYK